MADDDASAAVYVPVPQGHGVRINTAIFNSEPAPGPVASQGFSYQVRLKEECEFTGKTMLWHKGSIDMRIPPLGPAFVLRIVGCHIVRVHGQHNVATPHQYYDVEINDGRTFRVVYGPNDKDRIAVHIERYN